MKKNWVLSILMSIALLGGIFVPAGHYASAADSTTVTSDEEVNVDNGSPEEQELTADEQDLLDYIDALDVAGVYEKKALDAVGGSTYITSSNRKSIFLTLNNTAIPNYTKYVSMLKQIKPENAELKKIHDKLIRGSYAQLEAYQLFKKAVSKTKVNSTFLKQGNDKVAVGKKSIEQYLKEVQKYAEKLGYEF
ncbi:hypothetical protein [Paenibacillus silvae]|uniref:hypothetical protein n=1 Tax=Paenibacillus silvae TaxID=1325358 RepID=UPI0020037484|nr:hypothetical protein [Paenibacillus silvae]MCK6077963.1 hypothetical protein [Paenibacillus silvae]MCK6152162.1 hypothetical protein [Paenibacillus silvae]MCK6270847.1 hypothetical protein [Paenibacillus silvae]